MVGFDGTGGGAEGSAEALGRPLGRSGLTAFVDAKGGWSGVGSNRADVGLIRRQGFRRRALQGRPGRKGDLDKGAFLAHR
jgi:hypothetical protein